MYLLINGLPCNDAVDVIGHFICYQYERVSTECCRKCLSVKQRENRDCEYGDRSDQCRNIQPFDCYNNRTRNICCDRCRNYRSQMSTGISQCEYGDLTPRCTFVNQRRQLCYLPENERLCCITCPRLADQSKPNCKWGDQNPYLCNPFSQTGVLRINCYQNSVQQVCCETCDNLRTRFKDAPAGCEFGDRPVTISTSKGVFDCANYIRNFGLEVCDSSDINRHCCYTCYRYRKHQRRAGG
ncbi:hypothetical protein FSP39_011342 [Pinctada imbricata]|uniref:Uncharacterized protein n=1 Tax=Pinctada imbricata TaxID=66713 RepID=A0AA88YJD8_PINIB|nr:hypothetical protein FSP39_011342 [Pinctada imbricata]